VLELVGCVWGGAEGIPDFCADAGVERPHFLRGRGIGVADVVGHFFDFSAGLFILGLPVEIHGELHS
jgi:hypothetical protein